MIDLEITFENSSWEQYLSGTGTVASAAQLLQLLEGENENTVEDAMGQLEARGIDLDIRALPKTFGSGEEAVRLRQETEIAKSELNPEILEENDPLRLYLDEIARIPKCGDEKTLAAEAAGGNGSSMEALANLGLSFVIDIAREYVGYGVLLLDLIQEGSLGLWQAIQTYREGDYALWREKIVRLYMARIVFLQARSNGVGQKMRSAMEDFQQVDERLLGELGRNPTLEEIARELHMSLEQAGAVQKTLDDARILARVKEPQEEKDNPEDDQAVEDTALFQSRARVMDMLSGLDRTDAKLLSLCFGLEGEKPMSLAEAGRKLGLTLQEAEIRQAAALQKLRGEFK